MGNPTRDLGNAPYNLGNVEAHLLATSRGATEARVRDFVVDSDF